MTNKQMVDKYLALFGVQVNGTTQSARSTLLLIMRKAESAGAVRFAKELRDELAKAKAVASS